MDDAALISPQNSVLPDTPLSPPLNNQTPVPGPKNKFLNEFSTTLAKKLLFLAVLLIIGIPFISFVLSQKGLFEKGKPTKFELVESSPEDGDGNFSIVAQPSFVFSKKVGILEKDIKKYIQITPNIPGNWHIEKNGQVIYFSRDVKQADFFPPTFAYNSIYTIKIDKKIRSEDGQNLQKDITLGFRTTKNSRAGYVSPVKKLINFFPDQTQQAEFDLNMGNNPLYQGTWNVKIQTATVDQFLKYFYHKEDKNSLFYFKQSPENITIDNYGTTMLPAKDSYTSYMLINFKPIKKPGLYFVTIDNDILGNEDFFISVSNHINQVFSDQDKTYVWTTQSQNGESLPDVLARFYNLSKNPQLTGDGKTGNDGLLSVEKKLDDIDFVVTTINDDVSITKTESYFKQSSENFEVYSYSDRPVYRPGDTVHYKSLLRELQNGSYVTPNGKKIYARLVQGYKENQSDYKELIIDENGTVSHDFIIPMDTQNSYAYITLSSKTNDKYTQITSFDLSVSSYRKPDMEISLKTQEEYISKDYAKATIVAKTLYGKPLTNVGFNYRVIANNYDEVKDRTLENKNNYSPYYGNGEELTNGSGVFDNKGRADIDFSTDLKLLEKSQIATIEITPKIGASPSIGKASTLIHRGEFALFFENVKNLGDGIEGSFGAYNHNTPRNIYDVQNANISLSKVIDYKTSEFMFKKEITASSSGQFFFSFPNLSPSQYEITVWAKDKRDNWVFSKQQINVQKIQNYSQTPKYNLNIETQKENYDPGETATLYVKTNFDVKSALVIVYTEKQTRSIVEYNSAGENWSIPIDIPKYQDKTLGVEVITSFDGTVLKAHKDIIINFKGKKIVTTLEFDKNDLKPGETVKAQISTKDESGNPVSADNSLAVFDAALLQIRSQSLNPYSSFYGDTYNYLTVYNSTTGIYYQQGGGAGGCFLEGTKIRMADGSLKSIEDVKIGDFILTRSSPISNSPVIDEVTQTFHHVVSEYLTINDRLNVTSIHSIYLNNKWQQAKEAKIGDKLLDEYGNFVTIASIEDNFGQFHVYNLTTKNTHTFFAQGFYVHNDKGGGAEMRENFVDTAYWNPHIKTDKNGEATVSIKIPDNLTTFSAEVISITKDSRFGQTSSQFVSKKDISIIPTIPNFYYQDDKTVISALVQNSSEKDITGTTVVSIAENNYSKATPLTVGRGDYETIKIPTQIKSKKEFITISIVVKDNLGNTLDSLILKKPVLPRGSLKTTLESFDGSNSIDFIPKYNGLDFNTLNLTIIPHAASRLFENDYLSGEPNAENTQKLYVWSFILSKTKDGLIPPNSYKYAKMKNDFREAFNYLLTEKKPQGLDIFWYPEYLSSDASRLTINLWARQTLVQAKETDMADEVTNLTEIIQNSKSYILDIIKKRTQSPSPIISKSPNPISGTGFSVSPTISVNNEETSPLLDTEKFLLTWFGFGSYPTANKALNEATSLLKNSGKTSLESLKNERYLSSDDRFIFDGNTIYSRTIPALALIEKGSKEDSKKAIKGLSIAGPIYSYNSFTLLAGVKDALKRGIDLENAGIKVTLNGEAVDEIKSKEKDFRDISHSFTSKTKEGLKVKIETLGNFPFYTIAVGTQLNNNKEQGGLIDQLMERINPSEKTTGKIVDAKLSRVYKNIENGQKISAVGEGQSAVVELSFLLPFVSKFLPYNSSLYEIDITEAISPSFMYLNQATGNSTQDTSALDKLYPKQSKEKPTPYSLPESYSDQAVFFKSSGTGYLNPIFTYVVFGISQGSYHQPRTSAVLPKLGLIIQEK